ncbi:hypothetical protein BCR32DRAFT_35704 [Anaeromyces robustus]|uniref:Uncharacterized protein n=1 Tax=Anaeromyces robustus TaxID=1754192 RepID=A0A1Y1XLR0_9FUNG|nr:hypothetical protein BCR32DRAFT_35704 [Anaeromyces robustus]|eukprot:ORX86661.1 hypothetical protein BCR32DRAFT_35704 [Anaeromyces robustus]
MSYIVKIIIEAMAYSLMYGIFISSLIIIQGPLKQIYNYPPKIMNRVFELGLVNKKEAENDSKKYKALGFTLMIGLNLIFICIINKETSFWKGFLQSYIFFNSFSFFDALILDSLWFCNTKYFVIPGTEDMKNEYHNYWFHWQWFFIGLIALIPMAIVVGILTVCFGLLR